MTHEATLHIKQRKMQTNTTKLKLNPQVCYGARKGSCKTSCEASLQRLQQTVSALEPCNPGTLKSWSFETMETCHLGFLEPCNLGTLPPYPATLEL